MAKKSVNINNFSGGLNNNTNARDIAANEFAVLNNLDNETPGKLKLFGNVDNYYSSGNYDETHSTFNAGNGLIYLSTDRDVDDTDPALSNHEILFINDAHSREIDFYNLGPTNEKDEDLGQFSYGGTASPIDGYVIDGQLRLSATKTDASNNIPKWFGYINKTYNMGNSTATTNGGIDDIGHLQNKYYVEDMYIAPLKSSISGDGYGYDPENYYSKNFTPGTSEIVLNYTTTTVGGNEVAGDLNIVTGTNSNGYISDAKLGTAAATNTLLDDAMDLSGGHGTFCLYAFFNNDTSATDKGIGSINSNISVYTPDQKLVYGLFASIVYDENQESYPVYIGDIKQPTFTAVNTSFKRPLHLALTGRLPDNPRQSGIKVYWALMNKNHVGTQVDAVQQKYLLLDIDFQKGIRLGGADSYKICQIFNSTRKHYIWPTGHGNDGSNYWMITQGLLSLSKNEPYLNLNQSVIGRAGSAFKTSAIANRRAYIGNVAYYDGTNKVIKSDTVLKSDVNQFDVFRKNNFIDVEVNDGDEIVALETLGNQLLQFKRNTMYLINISRDIEYLEGTFNFRGCEKDYHVVKGEGFIAWFNKTSVYLYDGKRVRDINLNETGQPRLSNWSTTYYHSDATIGYLPEKKCLFIFNTYANVILQFDIKSMSWSLKNKETLHSMSNIVNDNSGNMVFLTSNSNTSTLKKWDDSSDNLSGSNGDVLLQTKDIDFGNPDTKKNINTIYINYKQPSTSRINVYGVPDVDGNAELISALDHTGTSGFTTAKLEVNGSNVTKANLKDIKSFALQLQVKEVGGNAVVNGGFEINDMQIVYREKVRR